MAKIILKVSEYDRIAGTSYRYGLNKDTSVVLELEECDLLLAKQKPSSAPIHTSRSEESEYDGSYWTNAYNAGKIKSCHLPFDHPDFYDGGDGEGGDG